jgi:acetylornithine/succinyldiaminopimelate/putrescine aminotransferase
VTGLSYEQIVALDAEHVMATYARLPVAFVRGDGTMLYDADGREYLDFLSGLAVVSLGHAHPEIAAAVAEQAATLRSSHRSPRFSTVFSVATAACSSPTRVPRRTSARSSSPGATGSCTVVPSATT